MRNKYEQAVKYYLTRDINNALQVYYGYKTSLHQHSSSKIVFNYFYKKLMEIWDNPSLSRDELHKEMNELKELFKIKLKQLSTNSKFAPVFLNIS